MDGQLKLRTHNLVSGFAAVHQISQKDGIFGAWESTCSHFSRTFLDCDPLVVLINGLQQRNMVLFNNGEN